MQPKEQSVIAIGGIQIRYLVDGVESGTDSGMFELIVAPGSKVPPPHSHTLNEEIIYVLDGVLRYSVDGEMRDLKAGERMFSPRGSVHAFSNPHDRPARALVVLTPDIGAQYFRDVAQAAATPGGPDPSRMVAVMQRYGLVPAPPPAG